MARLSRNLPERRIIHIYTEGFTEEKYFKKLRSSSPARKKINLEVKTFAAEVQGLPLMKYVKRKISSTKKSKKPDEAYVIFDRDELSKDEILSCLNQFPDYQIGLSNRSFELWLLLHFREVTSHKNQKELEDLLTVELGEKYEKGDEGQLLKIIRRINDAHSNAKNFSHLNNQNFKNNPYTNLSQIIKKILGE